ncbi:hypothetical protein E2C01_032054 [Portunus trituberculatus]|uniref:Uncharacterized protein n=1 Tax=Portunus trituberculatus TaxID=210409 RepID=A0A5B7EYN3_PORTR|nr:hypothetical protein [Portunus trituberculatus]
MPTPLMKEKYSYLECEMGFLARLASGSTSPALTLTLHLSLPHPSPPLPPTLEVMKTPKNTWKTRENTFKESFPAVKPTGAELGGCGKEKKREWSGPGAWR